jgi:hypothetical protein
MWRWLRPYRVWLARMKTLWYRLHPGLRLEGHVRDGDGRAVSFVRVRAVAVDLRAEEVLGEVTTDTGGSYEIVASASRIGSDVRVSVLDDTGAVLASVAGVCRRVRPWCDLSRPAAFDRAPRS